MSRPKKGTKYVVSVCDSHHPELQVGKEHTIVAYSGSNYTLNTGWYSRIDNGDMLISGGNTIYAILEITDT